MMRLFLAAPLLIASLFTITFARATELPAPVNQEHDHASLDLNQAFTKPPNHSEIRILSQQEMKETQGAVWPVVGRAAGGALVGAGMHAGENYMADRPFTEGIGYAAAVGAIGNAATGKLIQPSGGGLPANAAWRPGMMAIEHGVQLGNPANQQRCNDHQ